MLTSKEVLEKTGISRATLNNYISCGIVPRPEVLPPEPHDGAAPRIGYFPEAIIDRIEEIQRLKREGWSITRIVGHFTEDAPAASAPGAAVKALVPTPGGSAERRPGAMPGLSFEEIAQPAYLLNARFEVVWLNDAARSAGWPNFAQLPAEAVSHGIFKFLIRGATPADPRKAILGFHLGLAKQRGVRLADLGRELAPEEMAAMERLYNDASPVDFGLVAQTCISPGRAGGAKPVYLYAVRFREGILFLYMPGGAIATDMSMLLAQPGPGADAGGAAPGHMPALTQVAVLVADLQHSARLWAELPAEEYFELINHVWVTLEPIFRRHRGTQGKHPGDGMVCYFLSQPDSSYLWNALLAAHQVREAMRRLSKEWQLRKGWATELYMNTGIDEGQEWLGTMRRGSQAEFTVLGDAANHAAQISNFSRSGAVWVTRNLMGKLLPQERARLKYGVHRRNSEGREVFVASTFSRVANLADLAAAGNETLNAIAWLPITEVVDVADPGATADRASAARSPH